jgi:hypothetical protein
MKICFEDEYPSRCCPEAIGSHRGMVGSNHELKNLYVVRRNGSFETINQRRV